MNKKKVFILWVLCFVLFLPGVGITAKAAEKEKKVLFISSYSYSWESVQEQIHGIEMGLDDDVTFDCIFMDSGNIYDKIRENLFFDRLKYSLSQTEPYDVVILGDNPALSFGLKHKEQLFENIPILFLGVNDEELVAEARKDPMITGFVERLSLKENVEFGLRIYENAKKVYAVLDNTSTGTNEQERYRECAKEYPQLDFEEINASDLSSAELREAIRNVEEESILIYITLLEDADGNSYSNKGALKLLLENSKVPVFRMVESGMGDGLLGGYVLSMEETGRETALMAMAIIEGRNPQTIAVITRNSNFYMLDEAVMRKFGINTSLIPEGAVVLNSKPSYFERNKEVLVPGGILCLAMIAMIAIIGVDNIKRRKLLQQLEDNKVILESASQHDFLTGLPNRSKFMEDFQNLVKAKCPCTIMMIDIDNFKSINDNYGHNAGDEALQQLALRLKDMQTQILTAYRFAGDEFILILKSNQGKIVERAVFQCKEVFSKSFPVCGNKMKINGSIGVASYPKDADDPEKLVVYADDAMYQVKKNGKNDVGFYQKKESK